jgi:hypothetical protein
LAHGVLVSLPYVARNVVITDCSKLRSDYENDLKLYNPYTEFHKNPSSSFRVETYELLEKRSDRGTVMAIRRRGSSYVRWSKTHKDPYLRLTANDIKLVAGLTSLQQDRLTYAQGRILSHMLHAYLQHRNSKSMCDV